MTITVILQPILNELQEKCHKKVKAELSGENCYIYVKFHDIWWVLFTVELSNDNLIFQESHLLGWMERSHPWFTTDAYAHSSETFCLADPDNTFANIASKLDIFVSHFIARLDEGSKP